MKTIKEICPTCGKEFISGVNGTVDGCDQCTGVRRGRNGYAWYPNETVQTYMSIKTGKITSKKRPKGI